MTELTRYERVLLALSHATNAQDAKTALDRFVTETRLERRAARQAKRERRQAVMAKLKEILPAEAQRETTP
jgi:hypothetical protein